MPENRYDPLTVDRSQFPPNKKEQERPSQVAKATIEKPSTRSRMLKAIFANDLDGLTDKLIYDVIAPMLRDFIAGGIKNAVDMAFYGKATNGRGYTDYTRPTATRVTTRSGAMSQETLRDKEIERNLSFATSEQAHAVLDSMIEYLETYGQVSVADLCDMVGVDCDFTDNRYGWRNLSSAAVVKCGMKWALDLPRTRVIDL